MDFEVDSELSFEADDLLNRLNAKFGPGKASETSKTWLELLNYDFSSSTRSLEMEVDDATIDTREDIVKMIKESLEKTSNLSEKIFTGVSVNEVNRILHAVGDFLDETKFISFCNLISSWSNNTLLEYSLGSVILPKLQENTESSACIVYSIKQLALSKPDNVSQNLILPLLMDDSFQFTDFELLAEVFSVLSDAQRDFIILGVSKKEEFCENDWQLLNPVIKYLSQNSLLILMECILKYSNRFNKSQAFGRFLVSFCKHLESVKNKETLRETVEKHETLLKTQALKYLDLI